MKKITTKAGHTVLKVNLGELMMFGAIPPCCDSCCSGLLGENYYIGVLNSVYCEECYTKWIGRAVFYQEDADYEAMCIKRVEEKIAPTSKEKDNKHD